MEKLTEPSGQKVLVKDLICFVCSVSRVFLTLILRRECLLIHLINDSYNLVFMMIK